MAAEIGLDRHAKARALARLKKAGVVSVMHLGNEVPLITSVAMFSPQDAA